MTTVDFKTGKVPEDLAAKLKYLYRLKEKLRLYHNQYSQNYHDEQITLEEFREFQREWFKPRNMLVCEAINSCTSLLENDDTIECDIDDIEEL